MKIAVKLIAALWLPVLAFAQVPQRDRHIVIISLDGVPEYLVEGPQQTMPFLARMGRQGVHAKFMLPINPTVTWPNHTTIATGTLASKHGVLSNGRIEFDPASGHPAVNPLVPEPELAHAETIYDAAKRAGLSTGQVAWPGADGSPNLDWHFGECPDLNGIAAKEVIAAQLAEPQFITGCLGGPQAWRNRLWSDAAVQMIEKHKPNVLLIHILAADSIHHVYGTQGFASSYALAFDDDRIREIVEATKRAGIFEHTTFFVVSDHGHMNANAGSLHPEILLREAGIEQGEGKSAASPAWIEPDGGVAMVFIRDEATRASTMEKVRRLFSDRPQVSAILTGEALKAAGFPDHIQSASAPDMVLAAAKGYAFGGGPAKEFVTPASPLGSSHGYLNSVPEMHSIFFAWGHGIRNVTNLGEVRSIDVAPTAAKILGITLPNADGRVLDEILTREKK